MAAGSATHRRAPAPTLTVSQSSSKAIVDWSSFSIGQGGTVQFDNGSGATLNRVTGTSVSSIDGLLSATGSVYLINPNGVIVGKTGVVNTGGSFVASTLDVVQRQLPGRRPADLLRPLHRQRGQPRQGRLARRQRRPDRRDGAQRRHDRGAEGRRPACRRDRPSRWTTPPTTPAASSR